MLESIKTFIADEKVQAFALGTVAGAVIAGTATYFATRNTSTTVKTFTETTETTDKPAGDEPKSDKPTDETVE